MLVLFETAAGYALFKLLDEKKLKNIDDLCEEFSTPSKASELIKLVKFKQFESPSIALDALMLQREDKLNKLLKKFLKNKADPYEELVVGDTKLGNIIKEKLSIPCVCNAATSELMRGIRSNIHSLLGEHQKELLSMTLALAHSHGRYQVKFNPDKIDAMIMQGVSLLDDLDKELNNYIMRCKEWYGWHFPELSKVVQDPLLYVKTIKAIGFRSNPNNVDLSNLLRDDLQSMVKSEAEISMGSEISEFDMECITNLCSQVIELSEYRTQLSTYLKDRMNTLAPNLTALIGEVIGARLVSHAGSLIALAKLPASTIQIMGAEKALFKAIKAKKDTPKYGVIYHAQIVAQSSQALKGKMARKVAAKIALATRIDALADETKGPDMGIEARALLELFSSKAQGNSIKKARGVSTQHDKYEFKSEVYEYADAADSTIKKESKKFREVEVKMEEEEQSVEDVSEFSPEMKRKRKKHDHAEKIVGRDDVKISEEAEVLTKKKKKKTKKSSLSAGEE